MELRPCSAVAMSDHGGHRLHGPCRDLAAGTELKAGTLAAIAAWCLKPNHYTYANETDRQNFKKGMKQWVYFCLEVCKEEPAFACADGSTSYSLESAIPGQEIGEEGEVLGVARAHSCRGQQRGPEQQQEEAPSQGPHQVATPSNRRWPLSGFRNAGTGTARRTF